MNEIGSGENACNSVLSDQDPQQSRGLARGTRPVRSRSMRIRRDLAELTSVIAVIASLLFLAYEIRQSNRIARSTISYELANNYSELNEIVWTDPEVAALHVKVRDSSYVPTEVEEEMLLAEVRRRLNVWGAVESAYRNGHQTREQLDVMLADVEAVLADYPATHRLWTRELGRYSGMSTYEFYERARRVVGGTPRP